jgi:hypothetical protein
MRTLEPWPLAFNESLLVIDGPPIGEVQTFEPRVEPVRDGGYEFGQFDHPTTIDYGSDE